MSKKYQIEIDKENGWKICSICEKKKDLDAFLFKVKRNHYEACCKQCHNSNERAKPKRPIKEIYLEKGTKFCQNCQTDKTLDQFYLKNGGKSFETNCKSCKQVIDKQRNYEKSIEKDELAGEKLCFKCNQILKLEKFDIVSYGYDNLCRCCRLEIKKSKMRVGELDRLNGNKKCKVCQETKILEHFFKIGNGNYRKTCIECVSKKEKLNEKKPKWTDDKILELKKMAESGLRHKEMAKHFNIAVSSLTGILRRFGIDYKHKKFEKPWDENDDIKIKELFNSGASLKQLVNIFNRPICYIRKKIKKLALLEDISNWTEEEIKELIKFKNKKKTIIQTSTLLNKSPLSVWAKSLDIELNWSYNWTKEEDEMLKNSLRNNEPITFIAKKNG